MLAYLVIIATSALGYADAPWWSLFCGAAALAALGSLQFQPLRPRFIAIGAPHLLETAMQARIGHSVIAAVAAFAWGAVVRLALGS
jgi:hypothetical protein